MKYDPDKHHRHSIRRQDYDYARAGAYFVTICTENHHHLFGEIIDNEMILNEFGEIVRSEWEKSEKIRDEIKLHKYIVMPNHFHAIVEIINPNGRGERPFARTFAFPKSKKCPESPMMMPKSVGSLMAGYKSSVTAKINTIRKSAGKILWQRNYWDHIIRNADEYSRISQYIINNPRKWSDDKLNGGNGNIVMESQSPYGQEIWMV
jgi:REP-associated tyrosine transposase